MKSGRRDAGRTYFLHSGKPILGRPPMLLTTGDTEVHRGIIGIPSYQGVASATPKSPTHRNAPARSLYHRGHRGTQGRVIRNYWHCFVSGRGFSHAEMASASKCTRQKADHRGHRGTQSECEFFCDWLALFPARSLEITASCRMPSCWKAQRESKTGFR